MQTFREDDPTRGSEIVNFETPDSISSFVISAIAFSETAGAGVLNDPPSLTTFKPFFIQMDLPYSIKQSETLVQTINVFNYMDTSQDALMSVIRDEKFTIGNPMIGWESKKTYIEYF